MKKITRLFQFISIALLLTSCGEELMSKGTLSDSHTGDGIVTMSSESCSGFHFDKPPVDILFVIDNSGSTLTNDFQKIKSQIVNTIQTISDDFDYHVYIAPLFKTGSTENLSAYPVIIANPQDLSHGSYQLIGLNDVPNLSPFGPCYDCNSQEPGFDRIYNLIEANKTPVSGSPQRIFRQKSHLITVMISTGDDTTVCTTVGNNPGCFKDEDKFLTARTNLLSFKNTSSLNSEEVRFISLVPHSNCRSGWKAGRFYREMSLSIHGSEDTKDLCSGNYSTIFQAVNNSIQKVLVGHRYDHWVINPNNVSINEENIIVQKKMANGSLQDIPMSSSNGFTYIGYQANKDTRYFPDAGEPKTGLMVQLHGSARVNYPDCIVSKTKTPTEYYGYIALSKEPENLEEVKVVIGGAEIPQSTTNGWSFVGYSPSQNIKVVGPSDPTPASPGIYKTGYILKLHGTAIYSNSQTIEVFYKPKSI